MTDDTALSRALSHALRHNPAHWGLVLDEHGYTPVNALVDALRRDPRWAGVTADDITRVTARKDHGKQRHELTPDGFIRARYGHSTPTVAYPPGTPPPTLYHGTTPAAAARIRATGLQPQKRLFVHLSTDEDTARTVGQRRHPHPIILTVDTVGATEAGVVFHRGDEHVWLAAHVPARFIH